MRHAYESKDWDAIPAKWRGILRAWTLKMADELEERRSDETRETETGAEREE